MREECVAQIKGIYAQILRVTSDTVFPDHRFVSWSLEKSRLALSEESNSFIPLMPVRS